MSFLFISIGALIVFGIGPHISYFGLSIYGLGVALLFLIVSFFLPESPYYYVRKGRREDAKAVLKKLRGYTFDKSLEDEIEEIEVSKMSRKKEYCMNLL